MMPTRVRFLAVATVFVLAACAPGPPASMTRVSHPTSLAGTTWRLLTVQGRPAPAGHEPTITFDGVRVSGDSGCNSFGGQFAYEPATGELRMSNLASTLRDCFEPARIDVEKAYLPALQGAAIASIDSDGHLVLSGPATELVFEVGPRQVVGPIEGSPDASIAP
jgi:heat shock protein HslJ